MEGRVDIKKLTLEELVGVVSIYPWYSGARKELCARMSRMGKEALSDRQFADAALHMPSRRILADMVRRSMQQDWTDAEVDEIVKSYSQQQKKEEVAVKKVYAGVGDYFSQEEYDQVRREEDNVFSRYAARARNSRAETANAPAEPVFDLFTETLAQIYAEQGYYEQAKDIYSKLILAYPEKNAYFAALIQKIDELN